MSNNKYSKEAELRLKDFFRKKRRTLHPKGQLLLSPGSYKDLKTIYYIEKGRVIEYAINSKNEKIILNVFKEGAFFPMNHALAKTDVRYFFATDSEVMLRESTPEEVVAFVENNSVVLADLMTRVAIGMDGVLSRLSYALAGNLENKIMAELYLWAERFGYIENSDGNKTLKQELSVTKIASLTGASREATSRAINKMLKQDKIKRLSKTYTLSE